MSRKPVEPSQQSDKGKMRIFYVELEGSNQSLQDSLRLLAASINKPVVAPTTPRATLPAPTVNERQPDSDSIESPPDSTETSGTPDNALNDTASGFVDDSSPDGSSIRKRGSGTKQDRNAGLKLIPDLDFRPTGQNSLRDFFESKTEGCTAEEKLLVCAYYLTHTMKIVSISPDHLLTAFKEVNARVPADIRQTLRNMSAKKAWLKSEGTGNFQITTQGENCVEHDLPKSKAE